MQSVSSQFTTLTQSSMRPLAYSVAVSFTKAYDPDVEFMTIGVSDIGGNDIIKGVNDVVQEWDKFDYVDLSDRVISVEYNREVDPPLSSLTLATAEITFANNDDFFTPGNESSPVADYILPRRPVRIQIGFGSEVVPIFIGVTETVPIISESNKTAKIRCIDFLSSLINKPLDTAQTYVNMTSSEVISALLQDQAGLLASQLDLDLGTIVIPYVYFERGKKLGDALNEIAQADLGNISCTEDGFIRFQNRINWLDNVKVWDFNKENVLEIKTPDVNSIINVAEIFSNKRAVQPNALIWELGSPVEVRAGESVEIFANFEDDDGALPVISVDDPTYSATPTGASYYSTNENSDGSGAPMNADITLTSTDMFSTAFKMVFANSGSSSVYITAIQLYGEAARVVDRIYVREQNDDSVGTQDGFDEQPVTIENDYIQTQETAEALARIIIDDRGEFQDQLKMLVKGVPQLEIGDVVQYTDDKINQQFFVTRINGTLARDSGFRQFLEMTQREFRTFFRVGISEIGGTDEIGP